MTESELQQCYLPGLWHISHLKLFFGQILGREVSTDECFQAMAYWNRKLDPNYDTRSTLKDLVRSTEPWKWRL